jgi:hypothetical protein
MAIAGVLLGVLGFAGAYLYGIVHTVRHIPEAYAAWDTGTLLVEYMKLHTNRWPSSWDDLLPAMNGGKDGPVTLFGAQAGDTNYAVSLRKKVAIDWTFNPSEPDARRPVTRLDGAKFPFVWNGTEPNEMIRAYLKSSKNAGINQAR